MITGTEADFIVSDSLKTLALYKEIFETYAVGATEYPAGRSEVMFNLYDTWFHMLDVNEEFGLKAPDSEHPNTIWFNITVADIVQVRKKALANKCIEVQPVAEMTEGAIQNSLFVGPFGYMWMVHQINQELNFEERIEILEKEM